MFRSLAPLLHRVPCTAVIILKLHATYGNETFGTANKMPYISGVCDELFPEEENPVRHVQLRNLVTTVYTTHT